MRSTREAWIETPQSELSAIHKYVVVTGFLEVLGQGHPGPLDNITQLDTRRKVLAVLVLATFVLTFTPVPLTLVFPDAVDGDTVKSGVMILMGVLTGLRWLGRRLATAGRRG